MTSRRPSSVAVLAVVGCLMVACSTDPPAAGETTASPASEVTDDEQTGDERIDDATSRDEAPGDDVSVDEAAARLTVWADELRVDPMVAIAASFTDATGVDVVVEEVPFDEIRERVRSSGPAGVGPDIFVGAHEWTGDLAANGVIAPIDVSAIADSFVGVSLRAVEFEGRNYGIPYVTEAIAMYRNTDLVPAERTTWSDLTAACDTRTVEHCVVVAGGGGVTDAYHSYPFGVSSRGGYVFAFEESVGFDPAQVGLDSPESLASASFLEEQVTNGYISSTTYGEARDLWLGGDAAFWVTGPWELQSVRDQTTVPEWDVSVIPQMGEQPASPLVSVHGLFLSAFSEEQASARTFLLDHVSTDESMELLYAADPRGTAWAALQRSTDIDPQVRTFGESAADGVPIPNIPQMAAVWDPLGDNLLLIRNGELDARAAMTAAAETVRAGLAG